MLSINAVKGFEFGSGFEGVSMRGSEHNDRFTLVKKKIKASTNYAGGTLRWNKHRRGYLFQGFS